MDLTIKLSGNAGDGVQSVGDILTDGAALSGIHVFNFRSCGAEIRARGPSDATVRISEKPITSLEKDIDILVAIQSTSSLHWVPDVKKGGVVLFDSLFHGFPETMLDMLVEFPSLLEYGVARHCI